MSESVLEAANNENDQKASVYVFPGALQSPQSGNVLLQQQINADVGALPLPLPGVGQILQMNTNAGIITQRNSNLRTHARSASHGGVLASGLVSSATSSAGATTRPSALKKPGHQRAFSQGQVVDVQGPHPVTGHSRVGSKTDFILPPGHRDDPRPPTAGGKIPSFRGHSRQASR